MTFSIPEIVQFLREDIEVLREKQRAGYNVARHVRLFEKLLKIAEEISNGPIRS